MRHRVSVTVLLVSLASAAGGAPTPPNPAHDVTSQEVVYAVPGMDRVVVRRDIPYKKTDTGELKLDLYYPADFREGTKRPAVVFINGVGDGAAPEEDDERRHYYRITPFGQAVARAEAQRLAGLVKLARASGFAPQKA